MALSDDDFREEYKPLHIPATYHPDDTQENKVIYALAQLGEATANEVIDKLEELESGVKNEQLIAFTKQVLSNLYDKGLLKGEERNGELHYNLSKITHANDGEVDPDLL